MARAAFAAVTRPAVMTVVKIIMGLVIRLGGVASIIIAIPG